MKTQQQIVLDRLAKHGIVDNFWAIDHNILRLGAVIWRIRRSMNIETHRGKELKKPRRLHNNTYYILK